MLNPRKYNLSSNLHLIGLLIFITYDHLLDRFQAVQKVLGRELEAWETIAVGAVSGGLTAVLTTPFDVIKTRMMTAIQGQPTTMSVVALCILREEGPLGLFRGALPRFFWVAPLGAINFAGYELVRKAMD